jgi:hypothetical protein
MNENTLPEDLQKQITLASENYTNQRINGRTQPKEWKDVSFGYIAGATEYAQYKVLHEQAKALLAELVALRDAEIAPSAFISANEKAFIKVKQFLDQQ